MKKDDEIFESLIKGGLIGAALGAIISKDKEEGTFLGSLAGAALLATFKANEQAKLSNLPVYVEENGSIYEMYADGKKKLIKTIEKLSNQVPELYTKVKWPPKE